MALISIPIDLSSLKKDTVDHTLLADAHALRETSTRLYDEQRYMDALERTVAALRIMREFSDFESTEFRALLVNFLFDLTQIHFDLKDYKQAEKDLDTLFKVLEPLIKTDAERFGKYHVLAMELSTRILRSRKKTLDLLVKQQIAAGALYEKVHAGVSAATDRLVDSLRNIGELLASTGDYRGAMKFFAEAIKISKKRSGAIGRREVKMTIEMAEIMMRVRPMRPRALRLLNAILPHAIALETIELEEQILALVEIIQTDIEAEPKWKMFMHKLTISTKNKLRRRKTDREEEAEAPEQKEEK